MSSSSFICRLCYHDVPKGDRCKQVINGVPCKGTRLPSQALPKATPKQPQLHTKGAAEILQQQQQDDEGLVDGDEMDDDSTPEEKEIQFLEVSISTPKQMGLTRLVETYETQLAAVRKETTKEPKSQLEEAKELQVVVTDQAALLRRYQHNRTQQEKAMESLRTARQSHLDNQTKRL